MPSAKKTPVTSTDNQKEANETVGGNIQSWKKDDRVLCRYLNSDIYYEAKIQSVENNESGPVYSIHYQGWNSRHDEKVPHRDAVIRFKNHTVESAAKAKEELKKAQEAQFGKKRKSTVTPDKGDTSRGSTPMTSVSAKRMKFTGHKPATELARKPQDIQQIILPDALRKILIDDENLINKNMLLPKLPARITVFEIIQQYRKTVDPSCSPREMYVEYSGTNDSMINPLSENLARSALGLLDYFETTIGSLLLYKFERPMFNDLVEKLKREVEADAENTGDRLEDVKVCYSKQFGLPHLLRMFVRFSEMLSYTQWTERALDAIIRHAQDFVMFLNKNHSTYYDVEKDYVIASPDYHKRVWGSHA